MLKLCHITGHIDANGWPNMVRIRANILLLYELGLEGR